MIGGMEKKTELISLREVAIRLGVCRATVHNWVRLGLLTPAQVTPYRFAPEVVAAFRRDGGGEKLTRRANKSRSAARLARGRYRKSVECFRSLHLALENAMYAAALKRLAAAGEAEYREEDGTFRFRRRSVSEVMENWRLRLKSAPDGRLFRFLQSLPGMEDDESLGELYQALSSIGRRAQSGTYYTPTALVDESLSSGRGAERYLDPCCGSGHYLVRAAVVLGLRPEQICGIDCDPIAVELAKINLLLAFPGEEFAPRVFRGNALSGRMLRAEYGRFDLVATNPPWGGAAAEGEESFALFIRQALRFLKEGGRMSFLLPEAVLNIAAHASLRRRLLESCRIDTIELLGRCFPGVFTPVVRIDAVRAPAPAGHSIAILRESGREERAQHRVAERADCAIETGVTAGEREIVDKIFRRGGITLSGNADWALGIVTGDNARLLTHEPEPGAQPILRGCDIQPNHLREPHCYLRPGKLQQSAPFCCYRAIPKLVYRFIATRPVCAVDRGGTLTLNSANVLIPRLPFWQAELVARYLNSRLIGFLYVKRFGTCKILRKDLGELPFPQLSGAEAAAWLAASDPDFETLIARWFGLTGAEMRIVSQGLP